MALGGGGDEQQQQQQDRLEDDQITFHLMSGSYLPQPAYCVGQDGLVMTEDQLETLRRQISVYSTICHQLVEMHKASLTQPHHLQTFPGFHHHGSQHQMPYDPVTGMQKTSSRQRWSPTQIQLQTLEKIFEEGRVTPNKQRIKEITSELSRHGPIAETNVYNWFQNRKARAKRKQASSLLQNHNSNNVNSSSREDSEADTDGDSPENGNNNNNSNNSYKRSRHHFHHAHHHQRHHHQQQRQHL